MFCQCRLIIYRGRDARLLAPPAQIPGGANSRTELPPGVFFDRQNCASPGVKDSGSGR